jgi:hypothetical protein
VFVFTIDCAQISVSGGRDVFAALYLFELLQYVHTKVYVFSTTKLFTLFEIQAADK